MFQQSLYNSSGYTILSKDRAKGFTQIMKFEITQSKLFTYLVPSVLLETVIEHLKRVRGLPRIHICRKALYPKKAILEWVEKETDAGK